MRLETVTVDGVIYNKGEEPKPVAPPKPKRVIKKRVKKED